MRQRADDSVSGPETEGWDPIPCEHNALRPSFINYRVAHISNRAPMALEAGNLPWTVFAKYRELVWPSDAEKWFGVAPEAVEAVKSARQNGLAENVETLPEEAAQ